MPFALALELTDLIAKPRCFLEILGFRRFAHRLGQRGDLSVDGGERHQVASRNTCMSSSVAASLAGLSQRMRLMRGKRSATPDLWRVDCWAESKATSNTSSLRP